MYGKIGITKTNWGRVKQPAHKVNKVEKIRENKVDGPNLLSRKHNLQTVELRRQHI